jgi:fatty acid-binding protein DegV
LKEVVMGLGKMKKGMLVHAGAEAEADVLGTDRDLLQALGLESIGIIEANKFLITHIGPKALAFCGELAE